MRELAIAAEITQAFLTSERPQEVYRLALERVAPLVEAAFGCVFLFEEDSDLLRIVAAHNWPQRYAAYLGSMRVRSGNGPTGRAVEENVLVDVADVLADPELADWWDSARELGFSSAIALPLPIGARPVGALTLYFTDDEAFRSADRDLLRLVAAQLTATVEKAHLIDDLQRANERLRAQNVDLEIRYREAEEAKRARHELLANVSHELRTPLTAILGHAFLLKEGVSGPLDAEQMTSVRKIEEAGGRLSGLIDGLLDLTQVKLGRVLTKPQLCDAVVLARAAAANAPAAASGVEVRVEALEEKVPVHTDPDLVSRVLRSLLSNAVKFTSEGSVRLRVRTEEPQTPTTSLYPRGLDVVWEVIDTGIGIAPDDMEIIFEEFRQADGSATRSFDGAGLGLALARGLARRLGGDISVTSAPGSGSTFLFTLPTSVVRAGKS